MEQIEISCCPGFVAKAVIQCHASLERPLIWRRREQASQETLESDVFSGSRQRRLTMLGGVSFQTGVYGIAKRGGCPVVHGAVRSSACSITRCTR